MSKIIKAMNWPTTVSVVGVAACYMGAIAFDPMATAFLTVFGAGVWWVAKEGE